MKTITQTPLFMALLVIGGALVLMSSTKKTVQQTTPWVAPKEADALQNPVKDNATATAEGKKLYAQYCVVCHGDKGRGDGIAAAGLTPKPADHSSEKIQKQSDGAIYWKMTNGRPPMAAYNATLKEEQRWALVTYIRTLAAPVKKAKDKTTVSK